MKVKKWLSIILCSLTLISNAQYANIIGKIVDAETNKGLVNVNIYINDHLITNTSDLEGRFIINASGLQKNDIIKFSIVGYESKIIGLNEFNTIKSVKLNKSEIEIPEITILAQKSSKKKIVLNKFYKRKCYVSHMPVNNVWIKTRLNKGSINAFYFTLGKKNTPDYKIREIKICIDNACDTAFYKLKIFTNDKNKPGELLFEKPCLISGRKIRDIVRFDLSSYNLKMPTNGLYVGIEYHLIEQNAVAFNIDDKDVTRYYPFLNFQDKEGDVKYWVFNEGSWTEFQKNVRKNYVARDAPYTKSLVPAISLILEP